MEELAKFIQNILRLTHWKLEFQISPQEEFLKVDFRGEDAGLFLSHQAEVMKAFEYICSRVFEHKTKKVVFDCNDYRSLREKELTLMAQVALENVKKYRQPHKFSPMSPDERRILHLALADHPDVRTESEGIGENRKVVILPK
jgi:spoIIIJ-associated protein